MKPAVYLDHNATTPIDDRVFETMLPFLKGQFGNASSRHEFGTVARRAIESAREQVAVAVGVQASQVIFVSGGTEANNLFIKGTAAKLKPTQLAISSVEHPCVERAAHELTKQGWKLRKLPVDGEGRLRKAEMISILSEPTAIVSVMLANNETGVILDVAETAQQARNIGAWMHSDAVQAFGKIPVNFEKLGVHALTISGHKIYGPKGAAALIVDKRIDMAPLLSGGRHEKGMRAGTENVAAIVGFGMACEIAMQRMDTLATQLKKLREKLEAGIHELGAQIFGAQAERIPNTSFFAFPGVEGETLVVQLDRAGFAVASGSACSSLNTGPSVVLTAMGVEKDLAKNAIRVSLGKDNNAAQIDEFLSALKKILTNLRNLSAIAV
jgi:cysteine desulfurase